MQYFFSFFVVALNFYPLFLGLLLMLLFNCFDLFSLDFYLPLSIILCHAKLYMIFEISNITTTTM